MSLTHTHRHTQTERERETALAVLTVARARKRADQWCRVKELNEKSRRMAMMTRITLKSEDPVSRSASMPSNDEGCVSDCIPLFPVQMYHRVTCACDPITSSLATRERICGRRSVTKPIYLVSHATRQELHISLQSKTACHITFSLFFSHVHPSSPPRVLAMTVPQEAKGGRRGERERERVGKKGRRMFACSKWGRVMERKHAPHSHPSNGHQRVRERETAK